MEDFAAIYAEAISAGKAAGDSFDPIPMVVGQAKSIFSNEIDTTEQTYFVADGVCGFAWVTFAGNTPWGRWAKKRGIARSAYPKGLSIWISDYNQSMQRKEAYATAFAEVLRKHEIEAYADSRMD